MAVVWFCLTIVFIAVEAGTISLVSIWFAGGAIVAMLLALFGAGFWPQLITFIAVSAALLACLRPLTRRYLKPHITSTNIDSLPGKIAVVTENIDNIQAQGAVRLNGVIWTARSTKDIPIPAGVTVRIDRVEGVKLFVTPAEGN